MTQEAMAQRIGLSRPHLANALQGRFGLAPDIVERFKALPEPSLAFVTGGVVGQYIISKSAPFTLIQVFHPPQRHNRY